MRATRTGAGSHLALSCVLLAAIGSGCGWSHGYVLREYDASSFPTRATPSLAGRTVTIKGVADTFELDKEPKGQPLGEPRGFAFIAASDDAKQRLASESAAIREQHEEGEFPAIGWVRNLFGMPIRTVRALTSPARWVEQLGGITARGLGARVVDPRAADPDLAVTLRLKYLKVDMYMVFHTTLVVEAEFRPRGRPPVTRTYFVRPSEQTAWVGAVEEFSEATRRAGQVLMAYVGEDMERLAPRRSVASLDGKPLD